MSTENIINLYDRIKELSYTVGSGNFGLVGAANGFSSFASVYPHNAKVFYAITDGTNYEVGSGVLLRADNDPEDGITYDTLVRSPIRSSNNNQLVGFPPGTKEVYVTYPATHAVLVGSGIGLNVPHRKGLAIWDSANILDYDGDIIWDKTFKALGIQNSTPEYGIDVGGSGDLSSCVRATGYFVGPTGVYFKPLNGNDSSYPGGTQYQHFEKNRTDVYALNQGLLGQLTGSSAVIELSGVVNQYILFKKQNAGTVFAGPPAACTPPCEPGYPSFRSLVLEDVPDLSTLYASFNDLLATSGALQSFLNNYTAALSGTIQDQYDVVSAQLVNQIVSSGELLDDFIVAASGQVDDFLINASGRIDTCCPITRTASGITIPAILANSTHTQVFSLSGVSGNYAVCVSPSQQLQPTVLLTYSFPSNVDEISSIFYNFGSQASNSQTLDFYLSATKAN